MKKGILLLTIVLLNCTMSFGQKKVANYYSVKDFSEEKAKEYCDANETDPIEGIWQSNDGFKYAIIKYNKKDNNIVSGDNYQIIILSHNTNNPFWKETYVKGFIEKTAANGVYNIDYYTAGQNSYNNNIDIEVQTCIGLLDASALFSFTKQDGDKIILIKMYPKTENSGNNSNSSLEKSSGTGFAISSNGYIVTNHHVIDKAKSIEVKGVNGNFTRKLTAELVVSDEKNDLAIIKINDPTFSSLGAIPYSVRQGVADVGENVFVLGYPLTNSMGEEVKLTNGIVSSKTGFQGDISTYQISAPVQPGNSGGPLFDKNGNLIGVVNAKHTMAENAGYAIKFNYVKNLIELLPQTISFPQVNLLNGKALTDQVKIATNYTYLIVVNDKGASYNNSNSNSSQKKSSSTSQNANIYFQKATEEWKNKNSQGALENINKSIELDDNNPDAYGFRGFVYLYGIRNYDKAITDFTKRLQMKYDDASSYFYRGLCYEIKENYIDANKDYTQCISLNKDNLDAYFRRALSKSNLGDRRGAIKDYDFLINYKGNGKMEMDEMSTVYNNKAYCLVELNELQDALPFVTKALELNNKKGYIWDTRGELYFKLGEFEKCIKDMTKAIELDESSDNSYYYRGLAKIKSNRNSEGCQDLSKAGELGKAKAYEEIKQYCK